MVRLHAGSFVKNGLQVFSAAHLLVTEEGRVRIPDGPLWIDRVVIVWCLIPQHQRYIERRYSKDECQNSSSLNVCQLQFSPNSRR